MNTYKAYLTPIIMMLLMASCGTEGPKGEQGNPGLNGVNGTVVTPIQVCSGITPTYPSNFPEYVFCINNQMYGVYSANGGFMTLLTEGSYSSEGINASCTFTVGANCTLSQ